MRKWYSVALVMSIALLISCSKDEDVSTDTFGFAIDTTDVEINSSFFLSSIHKSDQGNYLLAGMGYNEVDGTKFSVLEIDSEGNIISSHSSFEQKWFLGWSSHGPVYHNYENKIFIFDFNGNLVSETTLNIDFERIGLFNNIIWVSEGNSLLKFELDGSLIETIDLPTTTKYFQADNDDIFLGVGDYELNISYYKSNEHQWTTNELYNTYLKGLEGPLISFSRMKVADEVIHLISQKKESNDFWLSYNRIDKESGEVLKSEDIDEFFYGLRGIYFLKENLIFTYEHEQQLRSIIYNYNEGIKAKLSHGETGDVPISNVYNNELLVASVLSSDQAEKLVKLRLFTYSLE